MSEAAFNAGLALIGEFIDSLGNEDRQLSEEEQAYINSIVEASKQEAEGKSIPMQDEKMFFNYFQHRRKSLNPPQVKAIIRKKDKLGRNLCYDDETGKRVACGSSSKPGYGPKKPTSESPEAPKTPEVETPEAPKVEQMNPPETPGEKPKPKPARKPSAARAAPKSERPTIEDVRTSIDKMVSEGVNDDKLSTFAETLSKMTVASLKEVRGIIRASTKGKVKKDIVENIKDRVKRIGAGEGAVDQDAAVSKEHKDAYNALRSILGDKIVGVDLGDPDAVKAALRGVLKEVEGGRESEAQEASGNTAADTAGSEGTGGATEEAGGSVAEETGGAGSAETNQGGNNASESTNQGLARRVPIQRVPANIHEVNRRINRFENFFRSKGQHMVADWMGKLRDHVNTVGTDVALSALGTEAFTEPGSKKEVQYWGVGTEENNWKNMGDFIEAYLGRNGIIAVTGDTSDPDSPLVSALGKPDRFIASQDFKPTEMHYKDKLTEAKDLPGLEKSEDISKLMGKDVTHLDNDVINKLDETYGKGKWIVKCYDDNAAAGYGIFFPQRAEKIATDARNTIWQAGENLARYGFQLGRDPDTGEVFGIIHDTGDIYQFDTDEYNNAINGDARQWADRAKAAAANEKGAMLPEGSFMAQPAFEAVGISDADRAAGKTWHETNEGRVHLVTREDGNVEIIPHSTWLKGGNLPVVFENDDTKAMAQAAKDAISKLPPDARKGQVYAPDIMKTKDGYKVVELNAQGDYNGSGYLHDNHFTIDAYTSYLTGRVPMHVRFIRDLLSSRKKEEKSLNYRVAQIRRLYK